MGGFSRYGMIMCDKSAEVFGAYIRSPELHNGLIVFQYHIVYSNGFMCELKRVESQVLSPLNVVENVEYFASACGIDLT